MEKKRILCFGDSNTWGYNPETGGRYSSAVRYPRLLAALLNDEYEIIEEGQNGRTITMDDFAEGGHKNGLAYLIPCLETHLPLDFIIIMLGTNDLKNRFQFDGMSIAGEMQLLLQEMTGFLQYKCATLPHILLVSPPLIGSNIRNSVFGSSMGYERSIEVSKELDGFYKQLALQYHCGFIDAAKLVETSPVDSLHLTAKGHQILAQTFADYISKFPV